MPRQPNSLIQPILSFLLIAVLDPTNAEAPPQRWEKTIQGFEEQDKANPPESGAVLFIGSSSIRMWNLKQSFPDVPAINRGFGGSQIMDSLQYVDRIVLPYKPKTIVFYAGDNDIAAGKTPERVLKDFMSLTTKVHVALPEAKIVFIAIKPSISRWKLVDRMREANSLVREFCSKHQKLAYVDVDTTMIGEDGKPRPELFVKDGLHLSAEGYQLWTSLLAEHIHGTAEKVGN
ncbi:MAG: SGNH/GDSL hydrolase family protein [Planctomycetota bacterium]|nr:SGNH/GDSL hydrolase family protein [Planctomycetota bacterium]